MKSKLLALAVLAAALAPAAQAQVAYRCGNAYSQAPCPSARVVDIGDARSDGQRVDAQRVAALDRQLGDDMERARLAREAADKKGNAKKPVKKSAAKKPHASKIKWFRP